MSELFGGGGGPHASSHQDGGADEVNATGLTGVGISTDPLAVVGDVEMHDDKTVWFDDAKTWGIRYSTSTFGVLLLSPGGHNINFFGATITGSVGDNLRLAPWSEAIDLTLTDAGQFTISTLPTTTDPGILGALFTCTGAELAGLLAAGAKHILLSKGV